MKKYEYLKINRRQNIGEKPLSLDELNSLGKKGWLLVSYTWVFSSSENPILTGVYNYIFAREIV